MIAFMPKMAGGNFVHPLRDVLVNVFGNAIQYHFLALPLRGLCQRFRGIHHDALLPEKVLLHAFGLLRLVACLPLSLMFPQFGFATDRTTPSLPAVSCAVMDHGDLLRECRLMLHSISSQISILVAGLQRLEGQQRRPQPPLPPAAPGGQPPLPPPSTPAPASLKASSVLTQQCPSRWWPLPPTGWNRPISLSR